MVILEKLQKKERFTESECMIADYLLQNHQRLSEITIHQLSQAAYTSNATIIRMCRKLGYKGFREFRVALARELESGKYVISTVDYSYPFMPSETTETIVNSIYSLHKKSMDQVQSQLNLSDLEKIVKCLMDSRRIYLFGLGDVKLTIRSFMNKLAKIGIFPVLATENGEELFICSHITHDDCALFITYGANHASYRSCIGQLVKNNVPILALTANPDSGLVRHSAYHICVPDMEKQDKIATFYSQLVFEYLLNLIYALIYQNIQQNTN